MKFCLLLLLVTHACGQVMTGGSSSGSTAASPVTNPLAVATTGLPGVTQGAAYNQTLQATGGNPPYVWAIASPKHTVTIGWTASTTPGVTSYNVKRSTVSGGPYSTICTTSALSCQDSTVVNGTTYFYVVTAVLSGFESANSTPENQGIIPSSPTLPLGLNLATNGNISGTPSVAGNSNFTVQVTDASLSVATQNLSIAVTPASATQADNRYCNSNETTNFSPATDGVAMLPTACVYTPLSGTPSPGITRTVCPLSAGSCNFTTVQAALNAANCGDVISIQATQDGTPNTAQLVYNESVTIPNLACNASNWVRVQSSLVNSLPAEGNRIAPCWAGKTMPFGRPAPAFACPASGVYMPKIKNTSTCTPPSQTNPSGCSLSGTPSVLKTGANTPAFWRFIGLELVQVAAVPQIGSTIVDATNGNHIVFDRVIVHGGDGPNGQSIENYCKGVNGEGKYFALIDSYVYDVHSNGTGSPNFIGCTDAQAVYLGGTNNDPTFNVYKVVNNFLESSSEPFFSGGNAATQVPTDYEIRRNHTFHPLFWKSNCTTTLTGCQGYQWFGTRFGIKNLGELKNASRVLIEGNIFSNNWRGDSDQDGSTFLLTPKNPNGTCTVCTTNNIVFRYNFTEHTTNGLQIAGAAATQGGTLPASLFNIVVHDNIFDDVNGDTWDANPANGCCNYGAGMKMGAGISNFHDVAFNHNTFINYATANLGFSKGVRQGMLRMSSAPGFTFTNFSWTNNIAVGGAKGYSPTGGGVAGQCDGIIGGSALILNACFTNTWCMDGNVLSTNDNNNTRPNTPYPGTTAYDNTNPSTGSPKCSNALVGNQSPGTLANVGFVNLNGYSGGDYRLCTGSGAPAAGCTGPSPYLNSSNDGVQPGANVTTVNQATAGVQ